MVTAPLYQQPEPEESRSRQSENINNGKGNGNDDEGDEDFYFGDRPPSTIDCTRPILATTSSSNSSASIYMTPPLEPLNASQRNASSSIPPSTPNQRDVDILPAASIPIHINTDAIVSTNDYDDDDSTIFSPSTPATHDDSDNIHGNDYSSGSSWPTITPSLSEINAVEGRTHVYQSSTIDGDMIGAMSLSISDPQREPLQLSGRDNIKNITDDDDKNTIGIDDSNDCDTTDKQSNITNDLSEQTKRQLARQKSTHSFYTPALALLSSQTKTPKLSLLRNTSRSSSLYSSQFYPALLSRLAQELHRRLHVRFLVKDDIEYPHAFTGKEAVECLLQLLRTNDRNLGLLVGRALDHQHFFHDVTYEHHLRDSRDKIYQFKHQPNYALQQDLATTTNVDISSSRRRNMDRSGLSKKDLPNGIFTLLTNCYSPTCSRDQGCYSVHCPRKGKLVKRSISQSSLQEKEENRSLWIYSVPKAVVDATSKEEIKRQECIYELIYTEADFVRDLQYVHNFWVKPLITQDIIPDKRRENFVQEVFWNMADIEKVNHALSQALLSLQKKQHVVKSIGDLLSVHVSHFDPFVAYGAHQIIGKFKFELEKKRNPVFAQFVQNTERLPESRRLELNGYLTKPITRLGKYNLLLKEILKRTPKDSPDFEAIPQVMETLTSYMVRVNAETGKCENIFNLQQIEERLSFKSPADHVDLSLRDPRRQMVLQGRMKRKGNTSSEASDLQVFLFDHYLVFAKIRYFDHLEYYKVYRKPIPLDLLSISSSATNLRAKRASTLLAYNRASISNSNSHSSLPRASTPENLLVNKSNASSSIIFYHHGRKGSPPMTLYAPTATSRKTWMEKITQQQSIVSNKRAVYTVWNLIERQFLTSNKVYDSILINNTKSTSDDSNLIDDDSDTKHTLLIGTDTGVYIRTDSSTNDDDDGQWDQQQTTAKRVIALDRITQIELMEDSQLLVLADKTLWTFPLADILDASSSDKPLLMKKGRMISTNTAFFHVGECMNKTMVCISKPNTLATTTIRVLEPIATDDNKKTKTGFSIRRLVRNGPVGLRPYKDLYLPSEASSISLLKTKMCISCPKEIGVVDMKSFGVQALLDPADEELDFVFSRQDIRPITIFRVQFAEYLVCYNDFGFFVDQRGRWIRSSHIMEWEGEPDTFALSYPYILAFEPEFIEVRNIISVSPKSFIYKQ
ncbi:unnamed protein product [Absidia cylindrospora]